MVIKLIPRELKNLDFPTARYLSNDEQKTYEEAVKSHFNSETARKSLLVNSNLFKSIFLNQIGIRTATLPELDLMVDDAEGIKLLKGFYEDTPSVILRSAEDSNSNNNYLAKGLTKKLKIRNFASPIIVNGLELIEDNDSAYGLNFDVKNAQKINAPDFAHKNNQKTFSRINPDYSLEFSKDSNRTLYTRDNGISRLYLDGNLLLGSRDESLANFDDNGRVVVVSGEATSQKILNEYANKINQETAKQIEIINNRSKEALDYVKTGKISNK